MARLVECCVIFQQLALVYFTFLQNICGIILETTALENSLSEAAFSHIEASIALAFRKATFKSK